jgi:hypothetical protein
MVTNGFGVGSFTMDRYEIVQEPTCRWAVFDTLSDMPADLDDQITIGLDRCQAMALAARANQKVRAKDARQIRHLSAA